MAAPPRHPNIVVLMADTVMRAALGCYGGAVRTPHIDALARHSHRFEQLYQPANMCQPSRVTWMTGCLPATTQVYANGFGNNLRRQRTILRDLADAGYQGGYLGLFHCWPGADRDGLDDHQWLDWIYDWQHDPSSWSVSDETARAWQAHLAGMGIIAPDDHLRDFQHHAGHTDFPLSAHPAVRISDRAISAIRGFSTARPNLLWTSFWMPHEPWAPPLDYLRRHDPHELPLPVSWREGLSAVPPRPGTEANRASFLSLAPDVEPHLRRLWQAYAGCMALVDEQIGRIVHELQARGLYDDTLLVFLTDHGTTHGAHGWLYKGGSFMIDEVSRVPCLLKLPGQRVASVIPDIVSSADLYPTLMELLGISHEAVDGRSWMELLRGGVRTDARAFGQHLAGNEPHSEAVRSLRTGAYKYNLYAQPGRDELYNLRDDPGEQVNRIDDAPRTARELRAELVADISRGADAFVVP